MELGPTSLANQPVLWALPHGEAGGPMLGRLRPRLGTHSRTVRPHISFRFPFWETSSLNTMGRRSKATSPPAARGHLVSAASRPQPPAHTQGRRTGPRKGPALSLSLFAGASARISVPRAPGVTRAGRSHRRVCLFDDSDPHEAPAPLLAALPCRHSGSVCVLVPDCSPPAPPHVSGHVYTGGGIRCDLPPGSV